LFASYAVALTVVPLFCAKLIKHHHGGHHKDNAHNLAEAEERAEESEEFDDTPRRDKRLSLGARFNVWFNRRFEGLLAAYDRLLAQALKRPVLTIVTLLCVFAASLLIYPLLGVAFFPRTEAGQFLVNLKAPSGTRLELTEQEVVKVENLI